MESKIKKRIFALVILSVFPISTYAQTKAVTSAAIDTLQYTIGVQNTIQSKIPSVPIRSPGLESKEIGIKIPYIGITIPPWDTLAVKIGQIVVEQMVNSTVNWINSGFNGSPAFVQDPAKYYENIANGIAGDFIEKSDLNFLCSPFQASIKLSVARQYYPTKQFQCTFTQASGNLQNFYNDFSQGGWDSWFQLTQEPQNNPYDSYVNAQVELDSRVARALGVSRDQLNWGSGFMSFKDNKGNIKTPGKVIEDQLTQILPTDLAAMVNAEDFDKIFSALASQLVNNLLGKVMGSTGLSGVSGNSSNFGGGSSSGESLECSAMQTTASTGDTVQWMLTDSSGGFETEYKWSGDDLPDSVKNYSSNTTFNVSYSTPGTKSASVTASTTDLNGNPKEVTVVCNNRVLVSQYRPLTVSCSPNVQSAHVGTSWRDGDPVTWTASVSGGSGKFTVIEWDGSQGSAPRTNNDKNKIWPIKFGFDDIFPKRIESTFFETVSGSLASPSGLTIFHPWEDENGKKYVTTQNITQDLSNAAIPITKIVVNRVYLTGDGNGTKTAQITVIDKDNSVAAVENQQCSGGVYVY